MFHEDTDSMIDAITDRFQERYGLIVAAAVRFARDRNCVDDIVQQTYIEFVCGMSEKKWNLEKDVGPLLYQIAKRKALAVRREQAHRRSKLEDLRTRLMKKADMDSEEALETTGYKFLALDACLEKLPPRSRDLIREYYFDGQTVSEIARREQKNEMSIYQLFFRIRTKLKSCIEQAIKEVLGQQS